ncbi:MAG: hypothetical protein ACRCX8_18425 [Sarcina sp.]
MKKGIMIFLSVFVLAIGGFFFVNNADATGTANPKMELETTEVLLEGYKGVSFKFKFTVNPGSIEFDINNPEGDQRVLKKNSLKVVLPSNLILESAKRGNETLDVVGGNVTLGDIIYKSTFIESNRVYAAEKFDVELTFKAITSGKTERFNESFTLEYEDLKGNRGKGIFKNKFALNIGEIQYKIGTIQGLGIKEATADEIVDNNIIHMNYPVNRYFTMQYALNPGELKILDGQGQETVASNLDVKNRDLIYVVDRSVLDLKGGNEETARESMIKSLEILKQAGQDINGYLILVGKKAEVIEVNKKSLLSIDELINQISKAEGAIESGNLGDGVRRAQMISDKNVENESSVVLVTNGNPNYYTQVSQGQKSLLYTRVDKDGHNEKDRELAEKYANDVVNDIAINEDGTTRWYSINYGERADDLIIDHLIKKLDGHGIKVQAPYYDDFVRINEKAISSIILKGKIVAKVSEDYKNFVAIASEDKEQDIELIFDSKTNEIVASKIDFEIKAKIINGGKDMEELGFDVANNEVVEVKFIVDSYDKQEHIFNKVLDPSLTNSELLTWRVKPTIPYIARMGLFNGNLTANLGSLGDKNITSEDILSLAQVGIIANNSLDELDLCDLAINNEFGYGMVIKPKVEDVVRPILKENDKVRDLGKEGVFTVYKLNTEINRFEKVAITDNVFKLDGGQIYLLTIDMKIEERLLNQSFDIGIEVNSSWKEEEKLPTEGDEGNIQPQVDEPTDSVKEYWTIKVNAVAQPEHF